MTTTFSAFTESYQAQFSGAGAGKSARAAKEHGFARQNGRANRANVTRSH
jgi:hypothetical protein